MTQDQLDLLHGYLNGTLDEADFARFQSLIRDSAEARHTLRSLSTVEAKLTQLAAIHPETVRLLSETARQSGPSFRWFSWRPLTSAAAVFLILGAMAWMIWPVSSETGLVIASADAAVSVERSGETLRLNLGAPLRAGDVVVSESAGIVLSYPSEETRLELVPATRLEVLSHRDGKRLRLIAGSLSADVAPQPENRPMRLFTTDAEAVVLGTRFTLNADPANRELAVQKGAVRVNRAATADSIVVSAEERVKLGAKLLELEPLPPITPPRWRNEHTLALNFETPVNWPMLRCGRVVANPQEPGSCLTGELVEVVRRRGDKLVLATSLRPQCVLSAASQLKLRYFASSGIESIELFLYVFGVERAFKAELKPEAHDRWLEWALPFDALKSAAGVPPLSDATVRSISVHTSPVSGPLAFYVDDVVLEHVSPLPLSR
jgi:ferric-dicitrate binding protein FerR (iron transport regulator)